MRFRLRDWIDINEAVKEKIFRINVNDEEFTISRESHIFDKRGNDTKPRDFKMSKSKYQNVFETFLNSSHNVNLKKTCYNNLGRFYR